MVFINDTILEKIETMTEIHFPNFSDIGFIIKSMPGRIISLSSSSVTRWIILCTSWTEEIHPKVRELLMIQKMIEDKGLMPLD